jgi:hypothetical protein
VRPGAIDVNVGTSIDVRRVREETGSDDGWLIARRLREITREYILRCSREPDLGDGAV